MECFRVQQKSHSCTLVEVFLFDVVGIALGERILNQKTKINKNSLIDFNTYCLCGDGDLMEGISSEAASFAGAMKLSNLIVLYDSNNISLDGKTNITFNENIRDKFSSLGWSVYLVKNGNSVKEINKAIEKAKKSNKPLIMMIIYLLIMKI